MEYKIGACATILEDFSVIARLNPEIRRPLSIAYGKLDSKKKRAQVKAEVRTMSPCMFPGKI